MEPNPEGQSDPYTWVLTHGGLRQRVNLAVKRCVSNWNLQ